MRFATTAELPAPGGQAQTYRLALGDIKVSGSKRVQVPPSGFYVATLVTNDVISVEGDQRVLRHTGDSWVVPAGQPLVLEPQGKNHRRRGTATISSQTASCYRIGTNLRAAIAALLQEGMVSLGMVNRDPNVTPTTTRSHHGPR